MIRTTSLLLLSTVGWLAATAVEAGQYVYPAKGQSSSRQAKDENECYSWATKQTGFDPAAPTPPPVSGDTKVTGSGARAKGAAGGALVAGIAGGNAATGALVGAAAGGITRRVRAKNAADKQNEQIAQNRAAQQASFDQARGACLTGRGYTIR
jgi:hypothetical protein